jgi:Domain of unknown function (DUF5916)
MIRFLFTLCIVFCVLAGQAQEAYKVLLTDETIALDGRFNEAIWQKVAKIKDFNQYFPNDTLKAQYDTEVMLAYDSKNLYVAAKMYAKDKKYVISSFRRDFRAGGNDNITFCFDTFNDHSNGFLFGTNPYGVMREGLMFNGGTDNSFLNIFWDNKWKVETTIDDAGWYCEMAIPFSTLRYKDGSQHWNFKSYRFDTQSNESSASVALPQNQIIMSLGYMQSIVFEFPLKKKKANVAIIPYLASKWAKDYENLNPNDGFKTSFGGDAKVGVTSGLNLDITINPDFSNVEADRQVVNLSRFDINMPEQRQFFLENSDLFTGFGSVLTNPFLPPTGTLAIGNQLFSPFFSRKIGIAYDSLSGLNVQTRINYGLRLSGKLDDNWRVGLMNTQTAKDEQRGIGAENFSVVALQRKIFDRSNIAAIFVNKVNLNTKQSPFNRVGGLEYNLISKDNQWQGKIFYHRSFGADATNQSFAHGAVLNYTVKKIIAKWSHDLVGEDFNAEAGFVPRKNFFHINPTIGFNFFPSSGRFNRLSFGLAYDQYNSRGLGVTDRKAGPFAFFVFPNTTRILASFNQNYVYLFNDFDALRSNKKLPLLSAHTAYTYYSFEANIVTDLRKKVSLVVNPTIGQYYDGNIVSFAGNLNYRFQPYGVLALNYSYNSIAISKGKNQVYLVGPNLDFTLSKKVFLTSYVQYNSQFKNLNINSRFQYRFAPVSDFFLVYTDNYNTEAWMPKNKAIFAKLTYWFSL